VPARSLKLVAFDGDDTLWHNERSFQEGRRRFHRLLATAGVAIDDHQLDTFVNGVELRNIEYYGYGVSSFILSLIETAIELTGGSIDGHALHGLIELAKQMLTEEIELFPQVREVVSALAVRYPLMLITKGDLLHQTSKLERSGLRDQFRFVEVVSEKSPAVYSAILSRHRIDPERFLMVGNSVRSDVLPVIAAGAWAAHVPAELTWTHEHAVLPRRARRRCFELTALDRLVEVIETIERGPHPLRRSLSPRAAAAGGRRRPGAGSRRS
jgi:putative hydrolase of the HAD superfamily